MVDEFKETFNVTDAPGAAEPDDRLRVPSCPRQVVVPISARSKTRVDCAADTLRSDRMRFVARLLRLLKD